MVNLPTAGVDFHVPFGGRKGSSYGPREQGRYAVEFYTTVKTAYTARLTMAGRIRVGVGGWVFEPWRGAFYPEGLRAEARSSSTPAASSTSIEINGTYYGSQKPASFRKWHEETPDDFVFAVKGPRFATNRRVLAEAGESIERFFGSGVMELKDKLGPVNWQFMATKKFDPDDFAAFLALLPKEVEGRPDPPRRRGAARELPRRPSSWRWRASTGSR